MTTGSHNKVSQTAQGWMPPAMEGFLSGSATGGTPAPRYAPRKTSRWNTKQSAGGPPATSSPQPPAHVERELTSFRSGTQHTKIARMKESRFTDPFFLLHQFAVQQRDLSRRPAETNKTKLKPEA